MTIGSNIFGRSGIFRSAIFGGVVGAPPAAPWYLSGGIAAANCIAAYTPKGAASLAASYDNNAAPGNGLPDGTYDAAPGVAPTWGAATGWTFNGLTQYLMTGIMPASGWSALVQFNGWTVGMLFGEYGTAAPGSRFGIYGTVNYHSGQTLGVAPALAAGNLGIAGQQGFRNGIADGGPIGAWLNAAIVGIYIGARNLNNVPQDYAAAVITALSVYNTALPAAQMLAVETEMAAI